jgi:hypothetical protein
MRMTLDVATCMYHTGLDPFTKKPAGAAKAMGDRALQRALMQFFKPENYLAVREVLTRAGRADLIGDGCDCLIPAHPPKVALAARRKDANKALKADYYHAVPVSKKPKADQPGRGYRPQRTTPVRWPKPNR